MPKKSQRGEIGGLCKNESECVIPDNLDNNLKVSCKRRIFKKKSDKKYLKGKMRSPSCMMKKCCWTDHKKIPKNKECEGLTITLHGEEEFVTKEDLQDLLDNLTRMLHESSSSGNRSGSSARSSSSVSHISKSSRNSSSRFSSSSSSSNNNRSSTHFTTSSVSSVPKTKKQRPKGIAVKKSKKRVTFARKNNIIGSPRRRTISSSNSSLISY